MNNLEKINSKKERNTPGFEITGENKNETGMRKLSWMKKEHVLAKLKTIELLEYQRSSKIGNDSPLSAL